MAAQTQYQTPGVYVVEEDGFSSSDVQVPTAIPVFVGYTEIAKNGNQDLTNVGMPIASMAERRTTKLPPCNIELTLSSRRFAWLIP